MDSRVVAREIKNEIWPLLRGQGFDKFSSKTAWRYSAEQIHVVNFQSFNSYLAGGVGCTTFSFALNLGIYFRAIPVSYPVRKRPDPAVEPRVYDCPFRRQLTKGMAQAILPRGDVWHVDADGGNLLECLADARAAIQRDGMPWFDRFGRLEDVLEMLMREARIPEVTATPHSPARNYMIGHLARALGRGEMGERFLEEAKRQFGEIEAKMRAVRKVRR